MSSLLEQLIQPFSTTGVLTSSGGLDGMQDDEVYDSEDELLVDGAAEIEEEEERHVLQELVDVEEESGGNANKTSLETFMHVVESLALKSKAPSTRRAYKAALTRSWTFISTKLGLNGRFDPLDRSRAGGELTVKCISAYIAYCCGDKAQTLANGLVCQNRSISIARMVRAAWSDFFNEQEGMATTLGYKFNELTGMWEGNPTLHTAMRKFIRGLKKHKAQKGENVLSVRSITSDDLRALYQRLESCRASGDMKPDEIFHRRMMYCAYVIAFICCLRSEELVHIRLENIEMTVGDTNSFKLRLTKRKTRQDGLATEFVLKRNQERKWLCPVRAFFDYYSILCAASQYNVCELYQGYLFRPFNKIGYMTAQKLTYEQFRRAFHAELSDIGLDPRQYGVHSFRRGGAQYLHNLLRKPIQEVCRWGGWTDAIGACVFRYLYSSGDKDVSQKSSFLPDPGPIEEN
jgi:hypothetical protein